MTSYRGLIALSGREVNRVLKLWTQTVLAPILSSSLFILVFGLSLGSRIRQIDGVSYDIYIVLSQRTGALFPGGGGLAVAMVAGALLVAPFGIAGAGTELLTPELLGAVLAVALASSVLPYSLELEALRRLPARVFGVLMSLEPAVAALAGLVVLGQGLAARDWLAVGLVVVASAGASTLER